MDIVALDSLRKGCTAQILYHLVPSSHDWVDDDWELLSFFKASLFSIKDHAQVVAVVNHRVKFRWVEFIIRGHELDPSGKYWYLSAIVFIKSVLAVLLLLLPLKNSWVVFLDSHLLLLLLKHFLSLNLTLFCVGFNGPRGKVVLLGQLFAAGHKVFLIHYVDFESWIIIVVIVIDCRLFELLDLLENEALTILEERGLSFVGLDHGGHLPHVLDHIFHLLFLAFSLRFAQKETWPIHRPLRKAIILLHDSLLKLVIIRFLLLFL